MKKMHLMLGGVCLAILQCAQVAFAAHPKGKLMAVELSTSFHLSSTAPGTDNRLELTEFINDGFNGVLLRLPSTAWNEKYVHQKQLIKELNEAGLWTAASPYSGGSLDAVKKQTANQVAMGVDWIELDEPFGINATGCYPTGWLTSNANYQSLKSTLPSTVPLVVADVHCNDTIKTWNIDGLMQEVYGTNMYPKFMQKVIDWRNATGKPGYVFINAYNRQLYNSCLVQTEDMFKTWTKAAWDNGLKTVLFSFSNRCSDCITNSDCSAGAGYGNDWPMVQGVVRGITAGTRVKFHEWDGFKVSSTQVAKPTVSVNVRSSQAGLAPSSVKCYYTTNYKGAYDYTPEFTGGTVWTQTPCTSTGSAGVKSWVTITAPDVPLVAGNTNRVRFKIKDLCTSNYYKGNRWSKKEYKVTMQQPSVNNAPTDISLSKTVVATNASVGAQVGVFSTVDPDAGDTFTYTFDNTRVNNNNLFSISGNQLKANSTQGYQIGSTYTVAVKSTDKGSASIVKSFNITTSDVVNNAPTDISLSNKVVATNAPVGTQVGVLSTIDPDVNDTFTYTFANTGVNNNNLFSISGNQLKTNSSQGYSPGTTYTVIIKSTDKGGASFTKTFSITTIGIPTDKVVITPGYPVYTASTIGLSWSPVSNASNYVVLWSNANNQNTSQTVTANTVTINANTTIDSWVSIYPCNAAGCGTPTYLGPLKKPSTPPTAKVVITPGYPVYTASTIGLSWSPVSNASNYVVLWSNANNQNTSQTVTTNWVIINADTTISSWISVYPCNAAGCGTPTYLGPLKKP